MTRHSGPFSTVSFAAGPRVKMTRRHCYERPSGAPPDNAGAPLNPGSNNGSFVLQLRRQFGWQPVVPGDNSGSGEQRTRWSA